MYDGPSFDNAFLIIEVYTGTRGDTLTATYIFIYFTVCKKRIYKNVVAYFSRSTYIEYRLILNGCRLLSSSDKAPT